MNNSQFTLANRKQIAELLSDKYNSLRYKTIEKFRQKQKQLRKRLINDHAEKHGVPKLIDKLIVLQSQADNIKTQVSEYGLELDSNNELYLSDSGPFAIEKAIDKQIAKELGTTANIDARFDSAMVAMMTVATLGDAEKLLKSVTEV